VHLNRINHLIETHLNTKYIIDRKVRPLVWQDVEGDILDGSSEFGGIADGSDVSMVVKVDKINHYVRRYLPAKNFGFVIVSTNKGLMKHNEAEEKNLGGCVVAYVY